MSPLWSFLGNSIGLISSRLGEDYVNACTESVEEIIVDHYKKQITFLNNKNIKNDLKKKIEKFCKEEDAHREDALNSRKGRDKLGLEIFKKLTKLGTRAAIEISKRI